MTFIHKALDWGLPQLVHLESELYEARVHFYYDDHKLIDMNSLITHHHLNLVLSFSFHVFAFNKIKFKAASLIYSLFVHLMMNLGLLVYMGLSMSISSKK